MKLFCCWCNSRLFQLFRNAVRSTSRRGTLVNPNPGVCNIASTSMGNGARLHTGNDDAVEKVMEHEGGGYLTEKEVEKHAHILWDYLKIDDQLKTSQLIFVLGNSDLRTADHAAFLYGKHLAPCVVVSGKVGHGTRGKWEKAEAEVFKDRLESKGVPSQQILVENQATNTGENMRFTQELLRKHRNLSDSDPWPESIILVQTPFMGRRSLATFQKQWEHARQVDLIVTSPPILMKDYPSSDAGYSSLGDLVKEMVHTMQRILDYPKLGFQVEQEVPANVSEAFQRLKSPFVDKEKRTKS